MSAGKSNSTPPPPLNHEIRRCGGGQHKFGPRRANTETGGLLHQHTGLMRCVIKGRQEKWRLWFRLDLQIAPLKDRVRTSDPLPYTLYNEEPTLREDQEQSKEVKNKRGVGR